MMIRARPVAPLCHGPALFFVVILDVQPRGRSAGRPRLCDRADASGVAAAEGPLQRLLRGSGTL